MEPVLEMLLNEDAFTGAGIKRQYDALKLSDLRLKNNTREISVQVSNLSKFLTEMVIPGSDDKQIDGLDPIAIDFLVNAYMVGMLKYGVDILDQGVYYLTGYKKYGEQPALSDNEENIARDPLSIFKRSFTISTPLKSTKYYQIYNELKKEAKLKTSLDFTKLNAEDGIRIWTNIEEKVRKRMKDGKSGIPKEVSIYQMVNASFLNATDRSLKKINSHINNIPFMKLADQAAANGMSEADYKRMLIDKNLQARNDLLESVINKLADMDDEDTHYALDAERALVSQLEGGCNVPIGAFATLDADQITLTGLVASLDGKTVYKKELTDIKTNAVAMGRKMGDELIEMGAGRIMQEIQSINL